MAQRHDPDLYHTASPLPVRWLERRRVAEVIRRLEVGPSHRVLEVGCGAGNVLVQVPGRRTGIDLSPFLLEKARRRLGASAEVLEMNAEAMTFPDATFDRVYCSEVLEHVLDPGAVLAEMARVLRPDGIAVVSVPNESAINRLKALVFSVPGAKSVLKAVSGYRIPDRMEDEWHLHEMDEALLKRLVAPHFRLAHLSGVPTKLAPLRWVAQLRPLR